VKVEDGAQRAQYPAVIRLLQHLGVLDDRLTPRLADYLCKPVRNTRNEIVGENSHGGLSAAARVVSPSVPILTLSRSIVPHESARCRGCRAAT